MTEVAPYKGESVAAATIPTENQHPSLQHFAALSHIQLIFLTSQSIWLSQETHAHL